MALQDNILRRKEAVASRWCRRILESYPAQTASFLSREQDPFRNPIGGTIRPAVDLLVELIARGADAAALREPLDDIVRLRAIQDFSAAEALRFILEFKQVVREELAADPELELQAQPLAGELALLDQGVDGVVLQAFDIYMECREQLYALRAEEGRRRTAVLLRRFGLEWEEPEPEPSGPPL